MTARATDPFAAQNSSAVRAGVRGPQQTIMPTTISRPGSSCSSTKVEPRATSRIGRSAPGLRMVSGPPRWKRGDRIQVSSRKRRISLGLDRAYGGVDPLGWSVDEDLVVLAELVAGHQPVELQGGAGEAERAHREQAGHARQQHSGDRHEGGPSPGGYAQPGHRSQKRQEAEGGQGEAGVDEQNLHAP